MVDNVEQAEHYDIISPAVQAVMALSSGGFAIRSQQDLRSFRIGRATVNHNSAMNSFRPTH